MADASSIENATRRLSAALDGLEAALERRRESDRGEAALVAQVTALGTDRSRLASELDQQTARAQRLDAASRDVAQRLDIAIETVRTVVDANQH